MFNVKAMKPVAYHKYPSSVHQRIFEASDGDMQNEYLDMKRFLLEMFKKAGIKSWDDNKVTFEMEFKGKSIFFGFYDSMFSVGFAVHNWK